MIEKIARYLTIGSLSILSVQAQDQVPPSDSLITRLENSNSNKLLQEVIIQENRIQLPFDQQNRNIQVIDQAMIRNLPVKSVNELLTYAAGVDVRQRGPKGTQADIGLDGGTFDQTLLLLNGVNRRH